MKRTSIIIIVAGLLLVVGALILVVKPVEACSQGCTPGFWKNHLTVPPWPTTLCTEWGWAWLKPGVCTQFISLGSNPWNFLVQDVPGLIPACLLTNGILDLNLDGNPDTLYDALNYQGGEDLYGKAEILLRAAVAGLLNGMTMDHFAPWQIIAYSSGSIELACGGKFNGLIWWANQFDIQNNRGCPFSP